MEKFAHEYEQMALKYLNPAPKATESVDIRLKEAQIYATLAVAQAVEKKVWDQLGWPSRKLPN